MEVTWIFLRPSSISVGRNEALVLAGPAIWPRPGASSMRLLRLFQSRWGDVMRRSKRMKRILREQWELFLATTLTRGR